MPPQVAAAIVTTDTDKNISNDRDKSSSNHGDKSVGIAAAAMNAATESEAHAVNDNSNNTNAANTYYNISSVRLGEWVAKIRKEYDDLQHGKRVPNLTPERIAEMNDVSFVWRVRGPRPRKGDPNFRLRLNKTTTTKNTAPSTTRTTPCNPDYLPPS